MSKSEDYYAAGKRLGIFALTATLVMTELNISTLIGLSSLGYPYGFSTLSLGMINWSIILLFCCREKMENF